MAQVDLWLDDSDIQAANAAGQFTLIVPPDAAKRGNLDDLNDDKAKASWIQKFEVVDAKWYEDEAKDRSGTVYPAICAELKFQVPPDAMRGTDPDPNAGKTMTAWYRVVRAAMKEKMHPKYKANNFALGKLNGLLRGIWGTQVFPHGQKVNLANFYSGTPAPVVGKTVVTNVRASRYEGERRDEITDFVPLELIGA